MGEEFIVVLDAKTNKVYILPINVKGDIEEGGTFSEGYLDALEQEGIHSSEMEWMLVTGPDFLRLGWTERSL